MLVSNSVAVRWIDNGWWYTSKSLKHQSKILHSQEIEWSYGSLGKNLLHCNTFVPGHGRDKTSSKPPDSSGPHDILCNIFQCSLWVNLLLDLYNLDGTDDKCLQLQLCSGSIKTLSLLLTLIVPATIPFLAMSKMELLPKFLLIIP